AGHACVAPDQRGYSPGARPQGVGAYVTQALVRDALDLMDALGHERFHLVGHDWGGQLAWMIAAFYAPARVRTLSILSRPHPAAFSGAMREDPAQSGRSSHHRAFQDEAAAARLRADDMASFRQAFAAQGVPEQTARAYIDILSPPNALESAIAWYRAAPTAELQPAAVPKVTQPTLYLWGDADPTVGRLAADRTQEYVEGPYRYEVIEGGSHFLSDQFPSIVSKLLLEHIAQPDRHT
ncbi:MAG TPA: alpha/beta hydrolase, partial [Caulobacteraceae bacterium]|nr:alpha/beta hydrolase [Caulobacteraceae bacterium]